MVGFGVTILELSGITYLICGIIWGTVYIRFRLAPVEKRNQSTENIALAAGLLLIFHLGHIWFSWPGLILRAEYFYNLDLMEFLIVQLNIFGKHVMHFRLDLG